MTPDSPLVSEVRPSPNSGERRQGARPDYLILHYTGMTSGAAALAWLCDPRSEVSAHYLVHEDGQIVQMVPEALRAWHAGLSRWKGRDDLNSRSIGIEIVNPGHEHGYRDFPPDQVRAVAELCRECGERWRIAPANVLAHSDIAPSRKQDPGERFPWDQLFFAGIGHFVEPSPLTGGRYFGSGDTGEPVAAFQSMLGLYGYDVEITGVFDETTRRATLAFQRHFRQERVDGVADASTIATLHRLLSALETSPFQAG